MKTVNIDCLGETEQLRHVRCEERNGLEQTVTDCRDLLYRFQHEDKHNLC